MRRALPTDLQWDVFCQVVDNLGDLGVCWRLATNLAGRGQRVRLWVDDASALAWMAPGGHAGVDVRRWHDSMACEPGDVVIATFGCELPGEWLQRMAQRADPPAWINLEYLSAETYVERCHCLPSPRLSNPGAGLTQWFFYPGFTRATGGLIREPDLMERQRAFDAVAWLDVRGLARRDGERIVSVFCYDNAALGPMLDRLAAQPTLLLATHGHAAFQVRRLLGEGLARGPLRAVALPAMSQTDYDHLLWASELNFVRGEDSWVRAQWAARPFVWQAYPQHDGAHRHKLAAFVDRFVAHAEPDLSRSLRAVFAAWNGLDPSVPPLPDLSPWQRHCVAWRDQLAAQPDLVSQLFDCVAEIR